MMNMGRGRTSPSLAVELWLLYLEGKENCVVSYRGHNYGIIMARKQKGVDGYAAYYSDQGFEKYKRNL